MIQVPRGMSIMEVMIYRSDKSIVNRTYQRKVSLVYKRKQALVDSVLNKYLYH